MLLDVGGQAQAASKLNKRPVDVDLPPAVFEAGAGLKSGKLK